MIRRSFRVGLWLGILLGIGFALAKSLQGQRDAKELGLPRPGRWDSPPPPVTEAVVVAAAEVTADEVVEVEPAPVEHAPVEPAPAVADPEPGRSWAEEPWTDDELPPAAEVRDDEDEDMEDAAPRRRRKSPDPSPAPAKNARKAPTRRPARAWVEPTGSVCPRTHPVKAKMASGLFHLRGMLNYERTRPDRCYASEEAAVADGLTKAKR
jgi:hypothetical protein